MYPNYNNYNDNSQSNPVSEVYRLRKIGEIDKAYWKALELFQQDPENDDYKFAYAWTLIDQCNRAINSGDLKDAQSWYAEVSQLLDNFEPYDGFTDTVMKQIRKLRMQLDPGHQIIQRAIELSKNGDIKQAYDIMSQQAKEGKLSTDDHESYGWVIYKYLKANADSFQSIQVRRILRDYIQLSNERPSKLHSQILALALSLSKKHEEFQFVSFLKLWGPKNFRIEDHMESTGQDGQTYSSLVSRIAKEIINYPIADTGEIISTIRSQIFSDKFDESMREAIYWNIQKSVKEERFSDACTLLDSYVSDYTFYTESKWHSEILRLAERVMKGENQYRFYHFLKKWDPCLFRYEDWRPEYGKNGEKYNSLANRALKMANEAVASIPEEELDDLGWLIYAYDDAIKNNDDNEEFVRTKALLLIKANRMQEAEEIYKTLVLNQRDKSYIWHEFSKCISDVRIKIGMLCKAISMENNEDVLGKIRLDLADALINIGEKNSARLELKRHRDHYIAKGWAIKQRVCDLEAACGDIDIIPDDDKDMYDKYIPYAEDYAYSDIPYTNLIFIDEWTSDDGKEHQKYIDGKNIEIVINPNKFKSLKENKIGNVWAFKLLQNHENRTLYIPLLVRETNLEAWSIIPDSYGYIEYINEEKKVYHIYTQDSTLIYEHFDKQDFSQGEFLTLKVYKKTVKNESRTFTCCLKKCDNEEAISHFNSCIVVVDNVNPGKQLFHYANSHQYISGIVYFDRTQLRPNYGDLLKISYFTKVKKEKNNGSVREKRVLEILKMEHTNERDPYVIRDVDGKLEINYSIHYHGPVDEGDEVDDDWSESKFAFVDGYYVPGYVLDAHEIDHDCNVVGTAICDSKGKWKVISLLELDY